jgi:hypothetical protein
MKLRLNQIDAFAPEVFRGNPAGVCPLEQWLPNATMQSIAAENNVAETAFTANRPQSIIGAPIVRAGSCRRRNGKGPLNFPFPRLSAAGIAPIVIPPLDGIKLSGPSASREMP